LPLSENTQQRQDSLLLAGYDETYTSAWQQTLTTAATFTAHLPSHDPTDPTSLSNTAPHARAQATHSSDHQHTSARIIRIASFEVAKPPFSWQMGTPPLLELVATLKDASGRAVFQFAVRR
jgi:hypothetical protein